MTKFACITLNQFVNFICAQNKSENYEVRANANQEVEQTTKDCVTYRRFRKALSIVNTIKETSGLQYAHAQQDQQLN